MSCINVARLKSAGVPIRLCSNMSTKSPQSLADTLNSLGFDISTDEVFTPIPAVKHYLRQNALRPFAIVDPGKYTVNRKKWWQYIQHHNSGKTHSI